MTSLLVCRICWICWFAGLLICGFAGLRVCCFLVCWFTGLLICWLLHVDRQNTASPNNPRQRRTTPNRCIPYGRHHTSTCLRWDSHLKMPWQCYVQSGVRTGPCIVVTRLELRLHLSHYGVETWKQRKKSRSWKLQLFPVADCTWCMVSGLRAITFASCPEVEKHTK